MIQCAYAPRAAARRGSRTRLVLCGCTVSAMGNLLTGTAPLFGELELLLWEDPAA